MGAVCKSCHAPVVWARTSRGKMMPVDEAPSPDGNARLFGYPRQVDVLVKDALAEARAAGEALHVSHYVTCPDAPSYRK